MFARFLRAFLVAFAMFALNAFLVAVGATHFVAPFRILFARLSLTFALLVWLLVIWHLRKLLSLSTLLNQRAASPAVPAKNQEHHRLMIMPSPRRTRWRPLPCCAV